MHKPHCYARDINSIAFLNVPFKSVTELFSFIKFSQSFFADYSDLDGVKGSVKTYIHLFNLNE